MEEKDIIRGLSLLKRSIKSPELLKKAVKRMKEGESVDYIIGEIPFLGFCVKINSDTLIPRSDTECWVEEAITITESQNNDTNSLTILDAFCGSGCIGIAIQRKLNCFVDFLDISSKALEVAKENIDNLCSIGKCNLFKSNIFSELPKNKRYDVITANPPYVESAFMPKVTDEPLIALHGGEDGMDFYHLIAKQITEFLSENGTCFIEIGHLQRHAVEEIFFENGLNLKRVIKDLQGICRCLIFTR